MLHSSIVGTFTFTFTQQASLDTLFLEHLIRLRHEHQEHYIVGLYAVYIGYLKKTVNVIIEVAPYKFRKFI